MRHDDVAMSLTRYSVADTTPRYGHGPRTFDDAMKDFGFDEPWLRTWLVDAIDGLDGGAGWGGHQFWTPPYRGYIAVGQPRDETGTKWGVGVYLRRRSLQYPDGGKWPTVYYPTAPAV